MSLYRKKGITNYIQMIGAGHVVYFYKITAICIGTCNKFGNLLTLNTNAFIIGTRKRVVVRQQIKIKVD